MSDAFGVLCLLHCFEEVGMVDGGDELANLPFDMCTSSLFSFRADSDTVVSPAAARIQTEVVGGARHVASVVGP